jgi:hypothetical protein
MSSLALIDYSLLVIFFICILGFLLLGTRSGQQQASTAAKLPALRESPESYIFLAMLFLFFIILAVSSERRGKQSNEFG